MTTDERLDRLEQKLDTLGEEMAGMRVEIKYMAENRKASRDWVAIIVNFAVGFGGVLLGYKAHK